jgi:myo-inositol 2-dehydrogenase / D-chiro-inositol 1-dehydrogenase
MTVRVGFIGAGGIACAHMNMLQMLDDVQITAISDSNKARAESVASRYLAKAYDNCDEMLDSENIDAIYVCIPPFAHEYQEINAARMGKHIFVEKPVASDLSKANEIACSIRESGVISAVGYHWRYQGSVDKAKGLLENCEIGMIQGYWMSGFPEVEWWRKMDLSGGQMVEQTTHIFDLARYLCGEVTEVYAAYGRKGLVDIPDLDIYDVSTASIKFESGAVGQISSTCMLQMPYNVGINIIAKDMVLEVHGDLKVIEEGHTEIFTGGCNSMLEESRAFIHAVKTGDRTQIRSDYEDALKTLAVTLACNESAKSGEAVKVGCEEFRL